MACFSPAAISAFNPRGARVPFEPWIPPNRTPAEAVRKSRPSRLALRRVAIDTYRENVAYLHRDCAIYRAEGFQALEKVEVQANGSTRARRR